MKWSKSLDIGFLNGLESGREPPASKTTKKRSVKARSPSPYCPRIDRDPQPSPRPASHPQSRRNPGSQRRSHKSCISCWPFSSERLTFRDVSSHLTAHGGQRGSSDPRSSLQAGHQLGGHPQNLEEPGGRQGAVDPDSEVRLSRLPSSGRSLKLPQRTSPLFST